MREDNYKIKKIIIEILGTIIGALFIAIGTSLFLLPNQLSTGGIAGLATITYYLLNIQMGTAILLLNIPLFIVAIYKIGKKFFLKSIIGTISLSIFIDIMDKMQPLTTDRFLACIYGGIIIGIGTAIIFKMDSSTGGTDLISLVTKVYRPNIKIGNVVIITDVIIVILNIIFFKEVEVGLYSAIAIYLMGKMVDIIFEGVYFTKLLIIISDKSEIIAQQIGEKVKRGATGLIGKGMYSNNEKLVLLCAASRGDISKIKEITKSIDSKSFVVVANAREVLGLGFEK